MPDNYFISYGSVTVFHIKEQGTENGADNSDHHSINKEGAVQCYSCSISG